VKENSPSIHRNNNPQFDGSRDEENDDGADGVAALSGVSLFPCQQLVRMTQCWIVDRMKKRSRTMVVKMRRMRTVEFQRIEHCLAFLHLH
jgi:hypothetical protein